MKVHYLQHVPFEDPGYIRTWLETNGHMFTGTAFYQSDFVLPAIDAIDALVIMGGPMGVYDETLYPWLKEEKAFITGCIRAGKKILGICLGAQLMAVCLGGTVKPASYKEIGWFPVTPEADRDTGNWLQQLFKNQPVVFHWHGDQFNLHGYDSLLETAANKKQAFVYTDQVIGLQFHLEVTASTMENMLYHGTSELVPDQYIQAATIINTRATDYIAHCNTIMAAILERWLA